MACHLACHVAQPRGPPTSTVYTYFLGPLDKTNNANWATKHWKGQHRLLLVPQLLRFALFSKRPRPYCELKHSVHNALQLACEPQR